MVVTAAGFVVDSCWNRGGRLLDSWWTAAGFVVVTVAGFVVVTAAGFVVVTAAGFVVVTTAGFVVVTAAGFVTDGCWVRNGQLLGS